MNNAGGQRLPPGYRFKPSDDEMMHHLFHKINTGVALMPGINDVNLYDYSPETLARMYPPLGDGEWYFFTSTQRKHPKGRKPERSAGNGFWKATTVDTKVERGGEIVGLKLTLVYHFGTNRAEGVRSSWRMHEFRVENHLHVSTHANDMTLEHWVLCKLYQNSRKVEVNRARITQIARVPAAARDEEFSNGGADDSRALINQQQQQQQQQQQYDHHHPPFHHQATEFNNGSASGCMMMVGQEYINPHPSMLYDHNTSTQQPSTSALPLMTSTHQTSTSALPLMTSTHQTSTSASTLLTSTHQPSTSASPLLTSTHQPSASTSARAKEFNNSDQVFAAGSMMEAKDMGSLYNPPNYYNPYFDKASLFNNGHAYVNNQAAATATATAGGSQEFNNGNDQCSKYFDQCNIMNNINVEAQGFYNGGGKAVLHNNQEYINPHPSMLHDHNTSTQQPSTSALPLMTSTHQPSTSASTLLTGTHQPSTSASTSARSKEFNNSDQVFAAGSMMEAKDMGSLFNPPNYRNPYLDKASLFKNDHAYVNNQAAATAGGSQEFNNGSDQCSKYFDQCNIMNNINVEAQGFYNGGGKAVLHNNQEYYCPSLDQIVRDWCKK